jgi:hypothetical protein
MEYVLPVQYERYIPQSVIDVLINPWGTFLGVHIEKQMILYIIYSVFLLESIVTTMIRYVKYIRDLEEYAATPNSGIAGKRMCFAILGSFLIIVGCGSMVLAVINCVFYQLVITVELYNIIIDPVIVMFQVMKYNAYKKWNSCSSINSINIVEKIDTYSNQVLEQENAIDRIPNIAGCSAFYAQVEYEENEDDAEEMEEDATDAPLSNAVVDMDADVNADEVVVSHNEVLGSTTAQDLVDPYSDSASIADTADTDDSADNANQVEEDVNDVGDYEIEEQYDEQYHDDIATAAEDKEGDSDSDY